MTDIDQSAPSREPDAAKPNRYRLEAIDRAASVLAVFETAPKASLATVARAVGLSESTTLRYLSSLAAHGFVDRDPQTLEYELGLRLFQLGQRALAIRDPRSVALPFLERLRERYDETVNFAAHRGDRLVVIESLQSTRSVKSGAQVGDNDRWHASGLGKSILGRLPSAQARGILGRQSLDRLTGRTLVDPEAIIADAQQVLSRGYVLDDGESETGLRCIAAPIVDARGRPLYAVSVSGPADRLGDDVTESVGLAVADTAHRISALLGHSGRLENS